jgi:predicted RNase H-related nuclease YkuK (DUF458 family)
MFQSPTYGELAMSDVRERILAFIAESPEETYQLVVGTDSQSHNGQGVDFVTAIVVHRLRHGGIYFWKRIVSKKKYVLRQRMFEEASLSLVAAEDILVLLQKDGITKYDVEIHVDIGSFGKTREMIQDIVGMIRGSGYRVKIKPESYAASKIADRYT